jgi:hypothetical protein
LADDPGLRETRTGLRRGTSTVLEAIAPPNPASVFSPEGDTSLPVSVSHRSQAPHHLSSSRCASIGLQHKERHFSAGVRKPNGTDFSEISRNTIRLARYLRNES